MNAAAMAVSAAAVYMAAISVVYMRASARMSRAAAMYAVGHVEDGDAEMERGKVLARRADKMCGLSLARRIRRTK